MIIAINGYISSGKDTFASILQYCFYQRMNKGGNPLFTYDLFMKYSLKDHGNISDMEIKKFADALKEIASIMLGVPREKFEDANFKNSELPESWWFYTMNWNKVYPLRDGIFSTLEEAQQALLNLGGKLEDTEDAIMLHKPTVRWFLQNLGTEAIRNNIHPNAWVNVLMGQYQSVPLPIEGEEYPDWIITDCRFPNEADAVRRAGGLIVRINRNVALPRNEGVKIKHQSETALDDYDFDAVIDNSGTPEDLLRIARDFITHYKLEQYVHTNKAIATEGVSRPFAFS